MGLISLDFLSPNVCRVSVTGSLSSKKRRSAETWIDNDKKRVPGVSSLKVVEKNRKRRLLIVKKEIQIGIITDKDKSTRVPFYRSHKT